MSYMYKLRTCKCQSSKAEHSDNPGRQPVAAGLTAPQWSVNQQLFFYTPPIYKLFAIPQIFLSSSLAADMKS